MPSAPVIGQRGRVFGEAGIDHHADLDARRGSCAGRVADRGEFGASPLAQRHAVLEAGGQRRGWGG